MPGEWIVQTVLGDLIQLRADGFNLKGDHHVFVFLMRGDPNFEFVVASVLVEDVIGGPRSSPDKRAA